GARRLVRDAYVDALLSTQIKKGPDALPHAMRIAYLLVAGAPPAAEIVDDVDAVAAAYATALAGPKHPSRVWWPTPTLVAPPALAAAASGIALHRAFGPVRIRDASERAAPPPRGAFAMGGKLSPGSPALSRAFAKDLPEFLIQLDRLSRARLAGTSAAELGKG